METPTLISVLVLFAGLNAFLIWFFVKKNQAPKSEDGAGLQLILSHINDLSKVVDGKLRDTSKEMQDSLKYQSSESYKVIRDITDRLARLDETNKQVISFADQLQSLQDVLKNPKQRGILGEYYLETLLKNVLPPGSFQMQYPFKDGTIVDAIVKVKDKIICIDSKFSLENYNRILEEKNPAEKEKLEKIFENDLKNRIIETSKYIKPAEGTMDFAFMFIPHEAIYYDLLVNRVGAMTEENLIQRAAGRYKVIIVSPTSFLAYLQTVLQGLKAMQIEETAKDIIKRVEDLGKHLKNYEEYHQKLGNAISTTVSHFNSSNKELRKVDKDVLRITDIAPGIESLVLEKPSEQD